MTEPAFEDSAPRQVWGPGRSWSPGYRVDGQNLDATPDTEMPEWREWALDGGPTTWPEAGDVLEVDRAAVRDAARALLTDLESYTALRVLPRSETGAPITPEEGPMPIPLLRPPSFSQFHPGVDLAYDQPLLIWNTGDAGTINHFHAFMERSLEQFFRSYSSCIVKLAQSVEEYELAEAASALSDLEAYKSDGE